VIHAEPPTSTPVAEEQSVTPLELFFDLVFVFAITQVTSFITPRPDVAAVG
jgi:low temperature requirement protein LtrA